MDTIDQIREKLINALQPSELNVIDQSDQHIGHPGAKSGGGHYHLEIRSDRLQGLTKLQAHRLIYKSLNNLIPKKIHALSIKIYYI